MAAMTENDIWKPMLKSSFVSKTSMINAAPPRLLRTEERRLKSAPLKNTDAITAARTLDGLRPVRKA